MSSVDGLVSGLDTTSLVSSLMSVERQPQVRLQSKMAGVQKDLDIYRSLNTKLAAVQAAAKELTLASTWKITKTSSSDEKVATVTSTTAAAVSDLSFEVKSLAKTHSLVSATTAADRDTTAVATGPFTVGGVEITDIGTGSLNDVAKAINASEAGVKASVVKTGDNEYRLQLTAKESGGGHTFSVGGTGLSGWSSFNTLVTGSDATLRVGDSDTPGEFYDITSSTNTFAGVFSGVTINAKSVGKATVSTELDPDAVTAKVQALVSALGDAGGFIRLNSSYNATSKTGGALLGDLGASQLGINLLTALSTTSVGGLTSKSAGITTDRTGTVSFDKTKFIETLKANPAGLAALFGANNALSTADDGIAERLRLVGENATDASRGQITKAIESRTSQVKSLTTQISAWDVRLVTKQASLKKNFTAMETALSKIRNQSSWLSGQINSLG